MLASENINELATALASVQAEIKNAPLNKVNPHFKSKYADLAGIRDTITPHLAKAGLSVVQGTRMGELGILVTTRLMHKSGQWIQSELPISPDMTKPQTIGSALTYARRYSLAAIVGIAADEDDDAEAATDRRANANGHAGGSVSDGLVKKLGEFTEEAALMAWGRDQDAIIKKLSNPEQARVRGAFKAKLGTLRVMAEEAARRQPIAEQINDEIPF